MDYSDEIIRPSDYSPEMASLIEARRKRLSKEHNPEPAPWTEDGKALLWNAVQDWQTEDEDENPRDMDDDDWQDDDSDWDDVWQQVDDIRKFGR